MELIRKTFCVIWLLFLAKSLAACDCGGVLPDWSAQDVLIYDVVFLGKVDSIDPEAINCRAWFKGMRLYKGICTENIEIAFDCNSACAIPFMPGEIWLVYADRIKDGEMLLTADFCSRTRPWVETDEPDEYAVYSRLHFQEELQRLNNTFPPQRWASEDEVLSVISGKKIMLDGRRDLQHATRSQMVWLIAASGATMILLWFVLKKWLK